MTRRLIPILVALLGFLTFPDGQLSMAQDGTDAQKPFITGDGLSFGTAASFSLIASFGGKADINHPSGKSPLLAESGRFGDQGRHEFKATGKLQNSPISICRDIRLWLLRVGACQGN